MDGELKRNLFNSGKMESIGLQNSFPDRQQVSDDPNDMAKNKFRRLIRGKKEKLSFLKARIWFYLVLFVFSSLALAILAFLAIFIWYSKDLPSPTQLTRREGFATRIFDRNGEILYDVYKEAKRNPVSWDDIPKYLKEATIAVEDKDFYTHPGFSWRGMARAIYNIIVHRRLEGGSTLTQQLIKTVLLTSDRNIPRKIKEFVLALQVERKYKKDEILLMYLNEAPYGGTLWGVGAASEQYFGKPVSDLNLVESVVLAGLPQRPTYFSPFGNEPTAYIDRAKHVLRRMAEDGYIDTKSEEEAASQLDKVRFREDKSLMEAPHFINYVRRLLEERYGEALVEQGGLRVTTSLDLNLQRRAEEIVKTQIDKVKDLNVTNGAAIVIDPETGEILSLVGSKDYFSTDIPGNFDVVTQSLRQPGSAIKPVTYAVALEKGYTAATPLMDVETVFPVAPGMKDYTPVNYDGKFHGPLQVRYALGNSINIPAVKILGMVGLENMLQKAYEMGISTLQPTAENMRRLGLSVTLGGGEVRLVDLASAYSAFANGGIKREPVAILKVEDNKGNVLEEHKNAPGDRVLSEEVAFIISDILADNNARLITFGERNGLIVSNYKVAVKTGTSNDKRDNWAIGWNPSVLVGTWVGNNDNSAMKKVASGISGATPIWREIISEALKTRPKKDFIVPAGVVSAEVDSVSGYRSHDGFPSRMEYFVKGTEPAGEDPIHTKLKLCSGQNKLATPALVSRGQYEQKEFFVFKEEDPISKDGKNRWQEAILSWMNSETDPRYHPPSEYCQGDMIEVAIDSPAHESSVAETFLVKLKTNSLKKITEVKVYADGELKKTFTERPYEVELTLTTGTHVIKATAKDEDGNFAEREARIGINVPWNWQPSPTPTPTSLPTITPSPFPTLIPTLSPPTGTPTLTPSPHPGD